MVDAIQFTQQKSFNYCNF